MEVIDRDHQARDHQAEEAIVSSPEDVLRHVLQPYARTKTDYLKSGNVASLAGDAETLFKMHGVFEIPISCYIDSTGHFNAVEFIICYNQLAYFAFGELISSGVVKTLPIKPANHRVENLVDELTYDSYLKKQLESMFIVKSSLRFKAPIEPNLFYADLSILKILFRQDTFFIKTHCRFYDGAGGDADGEITLAYRAITSS